MSFVKFNFTTKLNTQQKCNILIGNLLGDGSYDNRGSVLNNRYSNKQNYYVEWLEYLYKQMGVFHRSKYDYSNLTDINQNGIILIHDMYLL